MKRLTLLVLLSSCISLAGAQSMPLMLEQKSNVYNSKSRPAAIWMLDEKPLTVVNEDGASGLYNMTHVMRLPDVVVAIACEASLF